MVLGNWYGLFDPPIPRRYNGSERALWPSMLSWRPRRMDSLSEEQYIPRNYRLGIVNGALVIAGSVFLDVQAVIAVFLLRLGASPVLVGLVSALSFAAFMVVPLPLAPLIERTERKKRYYVASAVGRVVCLGGLVASVLVFGDAPPWLLGGMVVAMLFGHRAAMSIGLLSFYEIVSHSVPSQRRGAFFSWRRVIGGLIALGGAFLVRYLLDESRSGLAFPRSFAAIFACGLVVTGLGALTFCLVREPPMPVDRRGMGLLEKLREGWRVSRQDRTYLRLILCRVTATMRMVAAPFYVIYCLAVLGAELKAAAVFLVAHKVTFLVMNPVWARVSDGKGNAKLLRAAFALGVGAPLLALVLPWLPSHAVGPQAWGVTPQWIGAVALYMVYWAANCGVMLGGVNYLLEIAPTARRPSYIAMGYVYVAPVVVCAPLLGGWLATALGSYWLNFVIAAVFAVVTAVAARGLEEPRERVARRPAPEE